MKKKEEIKLNQEEFSIGFTGGTSGNRKKLTRTSRKDVLTSASVYVEDKLTGLKEEFHIPSGHYSRKEMQKMRYEAVERLMHLLISKRKKK